MSKFVANRRLIESWSRLHACLLLGGTLASLWLDHTWPLGLLAILSGAVFWVGNRPNWQSLGRWGGAANWVTSFRWMALVGLLLMGPATNPIMISLTGLGILLFDGVDGYLARRLQQQSVFGEYLDKETDALFVLGLGSLLYFQEGAGLWIIGIGILRYIYVILLVWFKPADRPESRSRIGQIIAVAMMGSLIAAFSFPPQWYQPILGVAGLLVTLSFVRSYMGLRQAV